MKLNFIAHEDYSADFVVCLANKNMSSWAVDLETGQALAQDICEYRQRVAELEAENAKLRSQFQLKDVQARDLGGLVLELQQECCKFRALVERGAAMNRLDECDCIAVTGGHRCFSCACKEALK